VIVKNIPVDDKRIEKLFAICDENSDKKLCRK